MRVPRELLDDSLPRPKEGGLGSPPGGRLRLLQEANHDLVAESPNLGAGKGRLPLLARGLGIRGRSLLLLCVLGLFIGCMTLAAVLRG